MKTLTILFVAVLFATSAFSQMEHKKFELKKQLSYLINTPDNYSEDGGKLPFVVMTPQCPHGQF